MATSKRPTGVDLAAIIQSLLLFLRTFLKEDFPENIFLLLVRIVILDVVVVRLVKHTVRVMVAIWILVSNSSCLAHG